MEEWIFNLKGKIKVTDNLLNDFISNVREESNDVRNEESIRTNLSTARKNVEIQGSCSKLIKNICCTKNILHHIVEKTFLYNDNNYSHFP